MLGNSLFLLILSPNVSYVIKQLVLHLPRIKYSSMINVKHRRIINTQDVMDFYGFNYRNAIYYMSEVRQSLNKKPKDKITVSQFCKYHEIPEQEFIESMLRPYPKTQTTL